MRPLNLFLIEHDAPTLEVGVDLPWADLQLLARVDAALLWDLNGDLRMLPAAILADLWRMTQAEADLQRLGRDYVRSKTFALTWDQAVPVTASVLAVR
jgi:hypothetical protein